MNNLRLLIQLLFMVLLGLNSSCKKIIDLNLEDAEAQLIIEGNLTDQRGVQTVKISESVPVNERNVFPEVSGASVYVTDDQGKVYTYEETAPGIYSVYNIAGHPGRTYTLNVNVKGKTYTANSVMPKLVILDSLTASEESFGKDKRTVVAVNYADPEIEKNYYLFKMTVNGIKVDRIFSDSDFFSDGRQVKRDLYLMDDDNVEIKNNDNVRVEMQCIDLPVYTYWRSLEQQYSSGNPNDVTTPSNPPSNLNNGALGYFSAHTSQVMDVVISR